MNDMVLTLTFYVREPVSRDELDHLTKLVGEAIDEKIGGYEYLVEDVKGYSIDLDLNEE